MGCGLQLRLTAEQQEQRQAVESAIEDLEEALKLEEEDSKSAALASELDTKKAELNNLLASFEVRLFLELIHLCLLRILKHCTRYFMFKSQQKICSCQQKMAIDRAKSGEGMRPSERRRIAEEREREQGGYPVQGGFPAAAPPPR